MNWYSVGAEAADQVAASMTTKRRRNFFTKPGEAAVIRFLTPATASFNYKRSFVKWAKGEKMLTSPGTLPDPFVEAGLSLQASFAWWILDRRVLKFTDQQSGEEKEVGPRMMYFADGQRTRKQLISFEKQMLVDENEARAEEGKDPLTLEEFNLTSYDVTVRKDAKAPYVITAKRPKKLTQADVDIVEKGLSCDLGEVYWSSVDDEGNLVHNGNFKELLSEELKPLSLPELRSILKVGGEAVAESEESDTSYSYSADEDDTISFGD